MRLDVHGDRYPPPSKMLDAEVTFFLEFTPRCGLLAERLLVVLYLDLEGIIEAYALRGSFLVIRWSRGISLSGRRMAGWVMTR